MKALFSILLSSVMTTLNAYQAAGSDSQKRDAFARCTAALDVRTKDD
jgi:hypothetical protein